MNHLFDFVFGLSREWLVRGRSVCRTRMACQGLQGLPVNDPIFLGYIFHHSDLWRHGGATGHFVATPSNIFESALSRPARAPARVCSSPIGVDTSLAALQVFSKVHHAAPPHAPAAAGTRRRTPGARRRSSRSSRTTSRWTCRPRRSTRSRPAARGGVFRNKHPASWVWAREFQEVFRMYRVVLTP